MNQASQTPKPAASQPKSASAPKAASVADRDEAIRAMAYTLYEARGCIGGHELEDWLRAEALVAQASAASPAKKPATAAAKPKGSTAKAAGSAAKSTGTAAKATPATARRAPAKPRTP